MSTKKYFLREFDATALKMTGVDEFVRLTLLIACDESGLPMDTQSLRDWYHETVNNKRFGPWYSAKSKHIKGLNFITMGDFAKVHSSIHGTDSLTSILNLMSEKAEKVGIETELGFSPHNDADVIIEALNHLGVATISDDLMKNLNINPSNIETDTNQKHFAFSYKNYDPITKTGDIEMAIKGEISNRKARDGENWWVDVQEIAKELLSRKDVTLVNTFNYNNGEPSYIGDKLKIELIPDEFREAPHYGRGSVGKVIYHSCEYITNLFFHRKFTDIKPIKTAAHKISRMQNTKNMIIKWLEHTKDGIEYMRLLDNASRSGFVTGFIYGLLLFAELLKLKDTELLGVENSVKEDVLKLQRIIEQEPLNYIFHYEDHLHIILDIDKIAQKDEKLASRVIGIARNCAEKRYIAYSKSYKRKHR